MSFDAREDPDINEDLQILLPPVNGLYAFLGTEKWLVRQAESEAFGLNAATQVNALVLACGGNGCDTSEISW
jgi:nitrite reductase (NAD(P)H)